MGGVVFRCSGLVAKEDSIGWAKISGRCEKIETRHIR